jgi:hypothetical protein
MRKNNALKRDDIGNNNTATVPNQPRVRTLEEDPNVKLEIELKAML